MKITYPALRWKENIAVKEVSEIYKILTPY